MSPPKAGWPLVILRLDGTILRTSDVRFVEISGADSIAVTRNSRYLFGADGWVYRLP